jgi:hypothetical protein
VFIRDRDGVELADDAAARARALEDIDRVSKASMIKRQDHEGPRFRVPFAEVPGVVPDT